MIPGSSPGWSVRHAIMMTGKISLIPAIGVTDKVSRASGCHPLGKSRTVSNYESFRRSSPGFEEGASRLDSANEPAMDDHDDDNVPARTSGEDRSAGRRRKNEPASTRADFTEPLVPAQFKLPRDLVASLKLHSISQGRSMSDIVLDCLTSPESVGKAWISTRRAG